MGNSEKVTIIDHFSSIPDPRIEKKTNHKLIDIIAVTICGVICGANTWTGIEKYGNAKIQWLKTFLELPSGIPSHDTFGNVFAKLSTEKFEKCFANWVQTVFQITGGQVVAIDGKTLRHSYDNASNKGAIHLVNAWASKNRMILGQVKTDEKSNEITAIPELIDLLDLNGCIVTIDAMGCQKDIAKKIIDRDADYILALKGNQGNIYDDAKLFFEQARKSDFKDINFDYHETVDGDHGRIETRRYWTIADLEWLQGKENWKDLNAIGVAEYESHEGDKICQDTRYFLCSIENNAKRFAESVRGHWGVENCVHWVLDVAFREDECRIRKDNAPANFGIVRKIALNLIRGEKTMKVGVENKRLIAGWNNEYLLKVLTA